MRGYAQAAALRFGRDERVLAWDVYNEPCDIVMPLGLADEDREAVLTRLTEERPQMEAALDLMEAAFGWLREVGVAQPFTAAVYQ